MNGTVARDESAAWSAHLTGGPPAASTARELLTDRLGETTPADTLHDLHLLTSELVTNSVLHADVGEGDTLELRVSERPHLIRVSVLDPGGDTIPRAQDPDPRIPGGMGLFLVDQISRRWGVARSGDRGTEVWFEVAR